MTNHGAARKGYARTRSTRVCLVPLLCLLATGCTGLQEWRDALDHDPAGTVSLPNSATVRQVQGEPVNQAPLLPQPGDIWAGVQPDANPPPAALDQAPLRQQPGNIWAGILPDQPAAASPSAAALAVEPSPASAPQSGSHSAPAPSPQPPSAPAAQQAPAPNRAGEPLVQLAATTSRSQAERTWREVKTHNRALLRGHRPLVERAEVNGRTVWRLRADGFSGIAQANEFCSRLVAPRLDCWVVPASPRP